jgi:hypothetical protein
MLTDVRGTQDQKASENEPENTVLLDGWAHGAATVHPMDPEQNHNTDPTPSLDSPQAPLRNEKRET